ncbi:hypothetical protein MKK67_19950 [Methylobacterium sp. J-072]|uniref:hypothetical protein n=1 Tax=Methylobacterium sp. J-072 TaxID=2836651 RepID=UPI001FB861AA|nr:hypothetical protein [Methylobacterium sp. J-072]MCJ2094752.1 hypothetical protein [Methylobacterium sp. J-072]
MPLPRPAAARGMNVLLRAVLALFLLLGGRAWAEAPVRQVFLVQDSGWMEPFLTAEGSQFRPLVEALVAAARVPGADIAVATFDQDGQVPGRPSPRILYDGAYDAARIRAAIAAIDLPRKAGSAAYADADFNGALLGAIRTGLRGRDGVIWMVTNNKNSPGNSAEVERNTAAFYAALRESDAISRIVAYPVRMPLKGRNFSEGGFVIYGIGYGAAGGRALEAAVMAPGLKALFSHPPVSLKPVLAGGLTLRFDRLDTGGLQAGLENGVLVVSGADATAGTALRLTAHLRNGLYPQRVAAARLALSWSEVGTEAGLAQAAVSPAEIADLAPQAESGPLAVVLTLPPIPRPSGLAGLFSDGRTVDGTLTLRLADLRLALDPAFLERVRPIFGSGLLSGDQMGGPVGDARAVEGRLPGLFRDYRGISEAAVSLPVRIEAAFSPWPLIAAASGALALAAAAGFGALALARARVQTVMLGTVPKRVSLRPYRTQTLRAPDGSRWQVRAGLWGPARATRLQEPGPGA